MPAKRTTSPSRRPLKRTTKATAAAEPKPAAADDPLPDVPLESFVPYPIDRQLASRAGARYRTPFRNRMRARTDTPPGLMHSPHGLGRGNWARSSTTTSSPSNARRPASELPAAPAPTMMTSASVGRLVMQAARPERVDRGSGGALRRCASRLSRPRAAVRAD